ncbi:MAG: hypothetical protein HC880_14025 [Bacteroidia bacterium]|nr:hypothetical protein [Bacteroidia bacterium]
MSIKSTPSFKEKRHFTFFTNVHRVEDAKLTVSFPTQRKTPWVWNPETGERSKFPFAKHPDQLQLTLAPLQSLLLVFEPENAGNPASATPEVALNSRPIKRQGPWKVTFKPKFGNEFSKEWNQLLNFRDVYEAEIQNFAGKVIYTTTFTGDPATQFIELAQVNQGITELYLNDQLLGTRWYGRHRYPVAGKVRAGENALEIHLTTTLANYAKSLQENAVAQRWTQGYEPIPIGLEGPVEMLFATDAEDMALE